MVGAPIARCDGAGGVQPAISDAPASTATIRAACLHMLMRSRAISGAGDRAARYTAQADGAQADGAQAGALALSQRLHLSGFGTRRRRTLAAAAGWA